MKHLATLATVLVLAATSSFAEERRYVFSEKFWGTDLVIFDDGSMVCTTGSTLRKPNDHIERLELVTSGSDAMLRLYNSAFDYEEGEVLPIGFQVDRGPVVEYTFVSAGDGALFAPTGPNFADHIEAFKRGQRLRTVNLYSQKVVSEYSLAGSSVNTRHLSDCAEKIGPTGRDYGPSGTTSSYR